MIAVTAAQTLTSVTATVTDTDGQAWLNGRVEARLMITGSPFSGTPTAGGTPVPAKVSGSLDDSGTFSLALTDTSTLDQTGGMWEISVYPNVSVSERVPSNLGYTVRQPIAGVNVDLTARFTNIPAPRFAAIPGSFGYNDGEVYPNPVAGSTYFNVGGDSSKQGVRLFDGSVWRGTGSGTGGTGGGGPITLIQKISVPSGQSVTSIEFDNISQGFDSLLAICLIFTNDTGSPGLQVQMNGVTSGYSNNYGQFLNNAVETADSTNQSAIAIGQIANLAGYASSHVLRIFGYNLSVIPTFECQTSSILSGFGPALNWSQGFPSVDGPVTKLVFRINAGSAIVSGSYVALYGIGGHGTGAGNLLAIPYNASPVFDGGQFTTWQITLTGNVISSSAVNLVPGNLYTFLILQDAVGGRQFAWPPNVYNATMVNSDPNGVTIQTFVADQNQNLYSSSAPVWYTLPAPPLPPPTVTGVSPNSGATIGGTGVTITGTNFVMGATVYFGSTAATNVAVVSATTITATTPIGSLGAVTVTVTNNDGRSGSLSNGYTYTPPPPPTVTSLSPTYGAIAGGTPVTLTGTNFTSGATVTFGSTAATNVTVVNSTTIKATTPAGSAGAVTVTVTVGGQSGSLTNGYTYRTLVYAYNCKGPAISGTPWNADQDTFYSSSGITNVLTSTNTIDTSKVVNPAPMAVYQTLRYYADGSSTPTPWTFNSTGLTASQTYTIRLHFSAPTVTAVGTQVFSISINGTQAFANVDIFAAVGQNAAYILEKTIQAEADGTITVTFTPSVNVAVMAGVELYQ